MFCFKCGTELSENAKFCPKCGLKIIDEELVNLVNKMQGGEQDAFEQFYNKTISDVRYVVSSVLKENTQDVGDIVQEVFMNVYQKIETLNNPDGVKTWLRTMARNIAINYAQKTARNKSRTVSSEVLLEEGVQLQEKEDSLILPEDILLNKERQQVIYKMLKELPKMQYRVMFEYYFSDKSISEISKHLGVQPGTIKSYLSKARDKMQEKVLAYQKASGVTLRSFATGPILYLLFKEFAKETLSASAAAGTIAKIKNKLLRFPSKMKKGQSLRESVKVLFTATTAKNVALGVGAIVMVAVAGVSIASVSMKMNGTNNSISQTGVYDVGETRNYITSANELTDEFMSTLKELAVSKIKEEGVVNELTDEVKEWVGYGKEFSVADTEYRLSDWNYEGYIFRAPRDFTKMHLHFQDFFHDGNESYLNDIIIIYSCSVEISSFKEIIYFPVCVSDIYEQNGELYYKSACCSKITSSKWDEKGNVVPYRGYCEVTTCYNNCYFSKMDDAYCKYETSGAPNYITSTNEITSELMTSMIERAEEIARFEEIVTGSDYKKLSFSRSEIKYEGYIFCASKDGSSLLNNSSYHNKIYIIHSANVSISDTEGELCPPTKLYFACMMPGIYERNGVLYNEEAFRDDNVVSDIQIARTYNGENTITVRAFQDLITCYRVLTDVGLNDLKIEVSEAFQAYANDEN